MIEIDTKRIEDAIYKLCIKANTTYDRDLYEQIYQKYLKATSTDLKIKYKNILKNIELSLKTKRPLCQDTGQVIVFLEIGQNVMLCGKQLYDSVNTAVEKAYVDNFYRKSVVKNALFCRENTKTNTPTILYSNISEGDSIKISVLIKGAGSENYSTLKMFKPTDDRKEIFKFIKESVTNAGEKSCPPLVLGIGAGGTMDSAAVLSKKAFFCSKNTQSEKDFLRELKHYLKDVDENILDIKLMTNATHIACLPVALTINCHSTRHATCTITEEGTQYQSIEFDIKEKNETEDENTHLKEIFADDKEKIKVLKKGEHFLLTGEIYTARDAAHQKIIEYYEQNKTLPFEIKDKIIFYAGPCPAAPDEIIGPIGPTTSGRMDKFCEFMHNNGLLASIGKGERSESALKAIQKYEGRYFSAQGGIACLLKQCVKKSEVTAFEELGTEAVRKLYVEKLPLTVEI